MARYIDTSALLSPDFELLEGDVIVAAVLRELDNLAHRGGEAGYLARSALRRLYDAPDERWAFHPADAATADDAFLDDDVGTMGDRLVTADRGLALRARRGGGWGVDVVGGADRVLEDALPEIEDTADLDDMADVISSYAVLRGCGRGHDRLVEVPSGARVDRVVHFGGIRPRGHAQRAAFHALGDAANEVVVLHGPAGTGKTLLALAWALDAVDAGEAERVLVLRPTAPVGRDIGFLPGTLAEKMAPWEGAVADALEALGVQGDVEGLSVEPTAFLRGRTLRGCAVIVDEAQNMTPLELKTILTRIGEGSRVVITGDVSQIDTPGLGAWSNGLAVVTRRMWGAAGVAVVPLDTVQRSGVAAVAVERL